MKIRISDTSGLVPPERDACAIICYVNKAGKPTHGNLQRTIEALVKMGHRAGEINGEGDGCGVLTDIPRLLWREVLGEAGKDPALADSPRFAVGHFMIPRDVLSENPRIPDEITGRFRKYGFEVLVERPGVVRSEVLATNARRAEPFFWQVGLASGDAGNAPSLLHSLKFGIERDYQVHAASLSVETVAYKVHGAPELLSRYYPELKRRDFLSAVTIGHSRYSTNTLPTVLRAQPFGLLGHNGEINTIARLREEAFMLGIPLPGEGSDSQDLNRILEGLINLYGLTLFEAMEVVFPPIFTEMESMDSEYRSMYTWFRRFLPASAQGPAAIISRCGDRCVFSVDAMGLRPLWFGETEKEYFASSELGVVPHEEIALDPKPLAPGEKIGLMVVPDKPVRVLEHHELRSEVYSLFRKRTGLVSSSRRLSTGPDLETGTGAVRPEFARGGRLRQENLLTAMGWKTSDVSFVREIARTGVDPVGSLGYDGPLEALAGSPRNIPDYFKEQVAVVTNPAIDRERETEHFSTRVFIGQRPTLRGNAQTVVELKIPILCGGARTDSVKPDGETGKRHGTCSIEVLLVHFAAERGRPRILSCSLRKDETVRSALERLKHEALAAVSRGSRLLLLDDASAFGPSRDFLDPFLAVAVLHGALKENTDAAGHSLRRKCSLVLRSGALRTLHDLVFALGMGADALCPYLMWELAVEEKGGMDNILSVLRAGLEKVISTMGTHEIGGYGKYFASTGLSTELAEIFGTPNFCGSERRGLTFTRLGEDNRARGSVARSRKKLPMEVPFRMYPKIWKMVGAVAKMEENYADLSRLIRHLENENPISIRHLADFRFRDDLPVDPDEVDTSVGGHDLPIIISAMSFGSQGETPFRIYAEAAKRLNIICMNGEGGEIADMLGKYRKNRGQQIASGRFGVTMEFLNSADILEIKVGQGAKPGEGGHLPGFKVTEKIAAARHAASGVSLISPSNNHDIYSIEDLAQIVEELRTANPRARISVKVPAVAGIGTIALGIAKAGADIINISGYDGGTGAARKHAIRHVGLPVEIGVREAHRALVDASLRSRVEIWADGGLKTGRDVVKLMLLGANRVGFGTMAMVIIGCTTCRGCHLGTCHVGIATQIETLAEAESQGLKRFVPRVLENGVIYQTTFFRALGQEIRSLTAKLGFRRTQDLVGKAELLLQSRGEDLLDLADLLAPVGEGLARETESSVRIIRKPLNYLTSLVSMLVMDAFRNGENSVHYDDYKVSSSDRAIGTYLAGAMTRGRLEETLPAGKEAVLHFRRDSIPGNGLAAFNILPINITVEGGAQDGVGKSSNGGKIVILKGETRKGTRVGGSVGKGLAYGAQGGTFLVQGNADSRACVRLSGADVVIGGRITGRIDDSLGFLADRANIKGFAFEYMTAGRVVVLGDPGPWICSGMTGGIVYCRLDTDTGMGREALRRRIALGAGVEIRDPEEEDIASIEELLFLYHRELLHSHQEEEADWVEKVISGCRNNFVKIVPLKTKTMPLRTTE
ncbi:MAG TPA: glutamate synthase-related protein [Geobacteraceae bacterium]|nr:glutamate synthase-related protein [Geobacteraceae bacterium]